MTDPTKKDAQADSLPLSLENRRYTSERITEDGTRAKSTKADVDERPQETDEQIRARAQRRARARKAREERQARDELREQEQQPPLEANVGVVGVVPVVPTRALPVRDANAEEQSYGRSVVRRPKPVPERIVPQKKEEPESASVEAPHDEAGTDSEPLEEFESEVQPEFEDDFLHEDDYYEEYEDEDLYDEPDDEPEPRKRFGLFSRIRAALDANVSDELDQDAEVEPGQEYDVEPEPEPEPTAEEPPAKDDDDSQPAGPAPVHARVDARRIPSTDFDAEPEQESGQAEARPRRQPQRARREAPANRVPAQREAPSHLVEQSRARTRKFPVFWLCYAILVVALLGIAAFAAFYTYDSLVRYENAQPQVYINTFMEDLKAGGKAAEARRSQCIREDNIGQYDSIDMLNARFDQGVGRSSYRVEEGGVAFDTSAPIYTIYADDAPYLTVHLQPTNTYTRIGLLSITDWEVSRAIIHTETDGEEAATQVDEGLSYDVSVPDNATVTINGKPLVADGTQGEMAPMAGFEYASQFVDVPQAATYHIGGLMSTPEMAATNFEGAPIELTRAGNSYSAASLATPNREPSQLPINPLDPAEKWSLLMTNDLGGSVDQVTSFLIPGSELYDQATAFINSIDITFVWSHSFTGFSDESVTNCIMYNDKLFSCDVRFNKNMVLSSGESRTDEFANTLIFAYVDNDTVSTPGWYLVNMQAIKSDGSSVGTETSSLTTTTGPTTTTDATGTTTSTTTINTDTTATGTTTGITTTGTTTDATTGTTTTGTTTTQLDATGADGVQQTTTTTTTLDTI